MFAQLTVFHGPRSPELVAAMARADRERIEPAIRADDAVMDALVATYVLKAEDGGAAVLSVSTTQEGLLRAVEVIMGTGLLPGEDPALLPGPDEVRMYEVDQVMTGRAARAMESVR